MVNKPLIRPYFLGGTLGGGRLTSHDNSRIFLSIGRSFLVELPTGVFPAGA